VTPPDAPMTPDIKEPNVEAGDYIEDDLEAWEAFLEGARRYFGEHLPNLREQFGDEGIGIACGAMLAYLADEHGVYLSRPKEHR
jgi:hypothetical protein